MIVFLFNAVAALLILFIVVWFWVAKGKAAQAVTSDVTVRVKNGAYSPHRIEMMAFPIITLHFYREDPSSCAEYVVFESLGLQEKLPFKKQHTIELKNLKPGRYPFSCQMKMYQGELIIKPTERSRENLKQLLRTLENLLDQNKKENFLIGVTGGSATGKSTLSQHLKQWLLKKYAKKTVSVIGADSFIYPNEYLNQHDLMGKKGFPESFDIERFEAFLSDVKSGSSLEYKIPEYSHELKDIEPLQSIEVQKSDVYIIDGINLLFDYKNFNVMGYLDFCIYLDIDMSIAKNRSVNRFLFAYQKAKSHPKKAPYFKELLDYTDEEIRKHAEDLWEAVDVPLLKKHIEPHKKQAHLLIDELPEIKVKL